MLSPILKYEFSSHEINDSSDSAFRYFSCFLGRVNHSIMMHVTYRRNVFKDHYMIFWSYRSPLCTVLHFSVLRWLWFLRVLDGKHLFTLSVTVFLTNWLVSEQISRLTLLKWVFSFLLLFSFNYVHCENEPKWVFFSDLVWMHVIVTDDLPLVLLQ